MDTNCQTLCYACANDIIFFYKAHIGCDMRQWIVVGIIKD
jgi:hypothetical protein